MAYLYPPSPTLPNDDDDDDDNDDNDDDDDDDDDDDAPPATTHLSNLATATHSTSTHLVVQIEEVPRDVPPVMSIAFRWHVQPGLVQVRR